MTALSGRDVASTTASITTLAEHASGPGFLRVEAEARSQEWWHPSDLTRDGKLDARDITVFRDRLQAADSSADFNRDGTLDARDFAAFIHAANTVEWQPSILSC